MEVESEAHLQFRAPYETCRMASLYFESEWTVDSLKDLYAKDREQWKDEFALLHEGTLDYILRKSEEVFIRLVRKSLMRVAQEQGDYWRWRDPIFWRLCSKSALMRLPGPFAVEDQKAQLGSDRPAARRRGRQLAKRWRDLP
jgi:hypothetical protein